MAFASKLDDVPQNAKVADGPDSTIDSLLKQASESGTRADAIMAEVTEPRWTESERFDWQHYVPEGIRGVWLALSVESRLVAYFFAMEKCELDSMTCDIRE